MTNGQAIFALTLCSFLVFLVSMKNSRTEHGNAEAFRATGELKSSRWMVIICFMMSVVIALFAASTNHPGAKGPTWPLTLFGLVGPVFVLVRSFSGVRLEQAGMRFGLRYRNYLPYSQMAQLELMLRPRDAVLSVVVYYQGKVTIGTDLACTRLLVEELQRRSGCGMTFRDYRGREAQAPAWW